jgi:pimeloyl-ACP methyl ester carboxylesterase
VKRALASMQSNVDALDDSFSSLKMPLLLSWGREDLITPLTVGGQMHADAPQSVLEIYDGCGHVALVDCAPAMGPSVVEFLAGSGPPPGSTIHFQ